MNDLPEATVSIPPAPPVVVLSVLANPVRWCAMQMMADGSHLTIEQLARKVGKPTDGIGKHLILMRNTGLVECTFGQDARFNFYRIPQRHLCENRVVDFRLCPLSVLAPSPLRAVVPPRQGNDAASIIFGKFNLLYCSACSNVSQQLRRFAMIPHKQLTQELIL